MMIADLFCGAGGLSTGFEKAGFDVIGVDVDEKSLKTWNANHNGECFYYDLSQVSPSDIFDEYDIQGIIGGPPCQGFSDARGERNVSDERNSLVHVFVDFVDLYSPDFFVMENVTGIKTIDGGDFFDSIIESYQDLGYNVNHRVVDGSAYGVPQKRKRVIVVGMKNRVFTFPQPTCDASTVREVLEDVDAESYRECKQNNIQHLSPGQMYRSSRRSDHCVPVWEFYPNEFSGEEIECLKKIYHKNSNLCNSTVAQKLIENGWLKEKEGSYTFTTKSGVYPHYNRLPLDDISPTILASDYRPREKLHPVEDRGLSVKEAAALQTFPKCYKFYGNFEDKWRQIGNAVPPKLSKIIAEKVDEDLQNSNNGVFSF